MSRNHVDEALGGAHADTPEEKLLKSIFPDAEQRSRLFRQPERKVDPTVAQAMSINELRTDPKLKLLAVFFRSLGWNAAQRSAAIAALLISETDTLDGGFFAQLCAEKALEDVSRANGLRNGTAWEKFFVGSIARVFKGNSNINLKIEPR